MDTSPNSTSSADIKRKLDEKIDYHLFESTSWPIADNEVGPFWRTVEEMGLWETVPGAKGTYRYTAFGIDCGAELAACFVGAHEPYEIPTILKEHGLIDECEEESFISFLIEEVTDEEGFLRHVEVLVRRAHGRLHRVKDETKLQGEKGLSDETG